MSEDIGWKPLLEFNDHMLRALAGFALGWLLWQLQSPEWPFFIFFALMCALGGLIRFCRALWVLVRIALHARKMRGYRGKGAAPKADKRVTKDQLKAKGLVE